MAKMRYRVLGASGMKVSEICLGTTMFGEPTNAANRSASSTTPPTTA